MKRAAEHWKVWRSAALALGVVLSACNKFPTQRLTDPLPEGAVPSASPTRWVLFDEEIRTGGGYAFFPEDENQSLVTVPPQEAYEGSHSIFYSWNGNDVYDAAGIGMQHEFAGFSLLVAPDAFQVEKVGAKDLSAMGYTKITFWAKGSLSENTTLKVEGPSDDTRASIMPKLEIANTQLTSQWKKFTVPATGAISAVQFKNVKVYVLFTMVYAQPTRTTNPGQGGYVYIDNLAYEK